MMIETGKKCVMKRRKMFTHTPSKMACFQNKCDILLCRKFIILSRQSSEMGEVWEQVVVGCLTICIFIAMFREMAPDIVFLVALTVIMLTEILPLEDVLKGFSNESLITIGALFLVVGAVQKSHVMDYLARQAFGIKSSDKAGTARMICSMAALSAVFNNIPLCNLMIPIVRDWARARGIPLSYLLIPLSYSVIAGGLCTMIGTSTSLIVQGLMQADIGYSFPFFAPGAVAVPATMLLTVYMLYAAPLLLPSRSGLIREVRDRAGMFVAEIQVLEGSAFIANDIGSLVGRLGLQQDSIIKIRRKCRIDGDGEGEGDISSVAPDDSSVAPEIIGKDDARYAALATDSVGMRNRSRVDKEFFHEPDVLPPHAGVGAGAGGAASGIADPSYMLRSAEAWGKGALPGALDDIGVHGFIRGSMEEERGGTVARARAHSHGAFDAGAIELTDFGGGSVTGNVYSVRGDGSSARLLAEDANYRDIINPSRFELIKAGDVIFIASAVEVVVKVLKTVDSERAGLNLLDSSVMDLPGYGSELIELVLSDQNPFVGQVLGKCSAAFAAKYKVAVISCRSRSQMERKKDPDELSSASSHLSDIHLRETKDDGSSEKLSEEGAGISEEDIESGNGRESRNHAAHAPSTKAVVLAAGDTLLCLAKASDIPSLVNDTTDFFVTSTVGSVPKPMSLYGLVPVAVFLLMICLVAAEKIRMCPAALSVCALFFMGGWLKGKDIPLLINLRLLMLMGCSISFAASMASSGLASTIAKAVIDAIDPSPNGALFVVYVLTLMVTETMSNNAAAALMYPISSAVAKQLGVSPIPFAYVIVIAATAAFMSPIGYQTHIMVWGPGGYKFADFVRFGFVPDMLFWLLACAIAPWLFPL
jgi:di/tricarboxylate transporter